MKLIIIILHGIAGACLGALILGIAHFIYKGEYDHVCKFFIPGLFWPSLIFGYVKHRSNETETSKTLIGDFVVVIWFFLYGIVGAFLAIPLSLPFVFLSDDPYSGYALVCLVPACGFWAGIAVRSIQIIKKKYSNPSKNVEDEQATQLKS